MDFLKYHEALDNKIKAQAKVIKVITGLTKLCLSPKTYMKKKKSISWKDEHSRKSGNSKTNEQTKPKSNKMST